jgi:hypothetical protein
MVITPPTLAVPVPVALAVGCGVEPPHAAKPHTVAAAAIAAVTFVLIKATPISSRHPSCSAAFTQFSFSENDYLSMKTASEGGRQEFPISAT